MRITVLTLFLLGFSNGLLAQSFKYDLHDNTGEGKLDRINGIEVFLNKLDLNIKQMKKNIEADRSKENLLIQNQVTDLKDKDLKNLEAKVTEIDKSLGDLRKEFGDLKKKVESDDQIKKMSDEQSEMKKEIGDLKGSLKSIQELMKVYESMGNRGKPIN